MNQSTNDAALNSEPVASITTEPNESTTRLSWPHLYLGALGFAISLYALRTHNLVARGGKASCGFEETFDCTQVIGSSYGTFLHIPLGVYGMAYFIVVIMMGVTTNPQTTDRQAALWRLLVMTAGFCGSIGLTYISLVKIKAACSICLSIHSVIFLLFVISLVQYLKARRAGA